MGRDVIDLILLEATIGELPSTGWTKAHEAYGDVVDVAWERALRRLRKRLAIRSQWLDPMSVLPWAREQVEERLSRLPPEEEDD